MAMFYDAARRLGLDVRADERLAAWLARREKHPAVARDADVVGPAARSTA